jgi:hypothetical protein
MADMMECLRGKVERKMRRRAKKSAAGLKVWIKCTVYVPVGSKRPRGENQSTWGTLHLAHMRGLRQREQSLLGPIRSPFAANRSPRGEGEMEEVEEKAEIEAGKGDGG